MVCRLADVPQIMPRLSSFRTKIIDQAIRNSDPRVVLAVIEYRGFLDPDFSCALSLAIALGLASHFRLLFTNTPVHKTKCAVLSTVILLRNFGFVQQIVECGFGPEAIRISSDALYAFIDHLEKLAGLNIDYNAIFCPGGRPLCYELVGRNNTKVLMFTIQNGADIQVPGVLDDTPWILCLSRYDWQKTPGTQQHCNLATLFTLFLAGAKLCTFDKQEQKQAHLGFCEDGTVSNAETQRLLCKQAMAILMRFGLALCIGLQSLRLPALVTCEILQVHFGMWPRIPFHCYWRLATAVKHFKPGRD